MYMNEIQFLNRVENKSKVKMNERKKWSVEEVNHLIGQYPDIPQEYIAYLLEVGAGSFRECQFAVHGWLEKVDALVGEGLYDLGDTQFLVFGDNYSGDFSGFIVDKVWRIAELWHDTGELYDVGKTFKQYIREQMLMDDDDEKDL